MAHVTDTLGRPFDVLVLRFRNGSLEKHELPLRTNAQWAAFHVFSPSLRDTYLDEIERSFQ